MEAKRPIPCEQVLRSFYNQAVGKTYLELEDEYKKELMEYVETCIKVKNITPNLSHINNMYCNLGYREQVLHYILNPSLYADPEKEKITPKIKITSVYLIQNKRNCYTKIGRSVSPKKREETLQSEEPELELIFFKENINASIEKDLHHKFAEKRIRGEWFNLSDSDIQEIIKTLNSL